MTLSFREAKLAKVVSEQAQNTQNISVVVVPTEADAQKVESELRSLSYPLISGSQILYFPGFVQAGVFRYESARRVVAKRLGALSQMRQHVPKFVVTTATGLVRMAPSLDWLKEQSLELALGIEADMEHFLNKLSHFGYTQVQRVEDVGEYAVRGSIVDLWTPGEKTPARVEFFGDVVDKLRLFRSADQRSFETKETLCVLPAREFVWPEGDDLEASIERLNDVLLESQMPGQGRLDILENLRLSVPFAGIDDVAVSFFDSQFQPFDELLVRLAQKNNLTPKFYFIHDPKDLGKALTDLVKLYNDAHASSFGKNFVSPKASSVFPNSSLLAQVLEGNEQLYKGHQFGSVDVSGFELPEQMRTGSSALRKFAERAKWVAEQAQQQQTQAVLFVARNGDSFLELCGVLSKYIPGIENCTSSEFQLFSVKDLLSDTVQATELTTGVHAALGDIDGVFFIHKSKTLVVSQSWLQGATKDDALESFSEAESAEASRAASEALLAAQFSDFIEGELIVHVQHGIAVYRGISTIPVEGRPNDFLSLEYANNDKIYVPVHKMHLVQRYMGASAKDASVLDSLRGAVWEKRKAKAKEDAARLARELMEHRAKHAAAPGHSFAKIGEEYLEFEAAFPFDETPDQVRAIREIMSDMSKGKAMDRILCGDVGFGKTEVAMRAAYRAVLDGKQVAWLVPTTILAHQHYRSMVERFKGFPTRIESLDRLATGKAAAKLLDDMAQGKIDIVVGTHRLLSKDVAFRDLGLLIVDEEHRFGVMQKEKIKTLSYGIDELAMTATPIPRTLQMAMLGLRDLSLLATPPKARLAVKTFVCPFDENIIRDAVEAELARGGQVFYVHNRVEELASVLEYMKGLLPNLRVAVGHGKMPQKELEKRMIEFLDGKYDMLLCTTIIESGIDMPNVNTIIVQNADHFGLSQLYQLRGRVGRRSSRGYAYFLSSSNAKPEDDGMRRLDIIKEHQELGSGFVIASNDLELRGAGNVLGDEQSGHVNDVGLETYLQMLDDAIKELGGVKVTRNPDVEIQIPLLAQIPETYVENSRERLKIYRRFFGARTEEALQSLLLECEDRFGPVPNTVEELAEFARIRRWLMSLGAVSLSVTDDTTEIRLSREVIQPNEGDEHSERLISRILDACNRHSKGMRITPDGKLLIGIRKKNFVSNKQAATAELKKYLSLLAGETHGTQAFS